MVICCASCWPAEALEQTVLCSAEMHPIPELGTGLTEERHLALWCGDNVSLNLETTCLANSHAFLYISSLYLICVFNYESANDIPIFTHLLFFPQIIFKLT